MSINSRGIAVALLLLLHTSAARAELPPALITYSIDVSLDVPTRTLRGHERITWKNPGDRPIDRIPIHLYLNAFAHERTTFSSTGFLRGGDLDDALAIDPDPWGWGRMKSVTQRVGERATPVPFSFVQPDDGNPLDQSLAELKLPEPIAPGGELTLEIEFDSRLPYPFARTGGGGDYFFAGQWFPKIGTFENVGVRGAKEPHFAARQFRGLTEFYADFADWNVSIEVPKEFVVAATGTNASGTNDAIDIATDGRKRYRFSQRAVHDFAFVTGSRLSIEHHGFQSEHAGPIDMVYVTPFGSESLLPRWRAVCEHTLEELGRRVGRYPYSTFTIVLPPFWAIQTGGMEYPTLVTGGPGDPLIGLSPIANWREPDAVLAHEISHNYFYGMLASNEQEEAFLDEGFTQFWEGEIMSTFRKGEPSGGTLLGRDFDISDEGRYSVGRRPELYREPIIKRPAGFFYPGSESNQVYRRPALSLLTAERLFGTEAIDRVFSSYFSRFAFHHPEWADFIGTAREAGGDPVADFLTEAFTKESVPDYSVGDFSVTKWEPPRGLIPGPNGATLITAGNRKANPEVGLDPSAKEESGQLRVEITDAGFLRGGANRSGGVEQKTFPIDKAQLKEFKRDGYWESRVRIDGPAWDHLPVDIEFRFADGVTLRDTWDGRSAWRGYRFVRAAQLDQVRIDPDNRLPIDPRPENNQRARKPDQTFAADWSTWITGMFTTLVGGLALWV